DVASKATKDVYDPKADVSAGAPIWTPDSKHVMFVTGDRAYNAVYDYDVATNKLTRVANKMLLNGFSLSHDGRTVAFALATSNSPADVNVADITFASPRKLTTVNPQLAN